MHNGVNTPSKHCSIKFLSSLRRTRYCTESGKEYARHEVEQLLREKAELKMQEQEKRMRHQSNDLIEFQEFLNNNYDNVMYVEAMRSWDRILDQIRKKA
jgi:ribosomal protein L44E